MDPADPGNVPLILGDNANDLTIEGMVLPTEDDGDSWALRFTTTGMTGDGWLTVDYDFILTEG